MSKMKHPERFTLTLTAYLPLEKLQQLAAVRAEMSRRLRSKVTPEEALVMCASIGLQTQFAALPKKLKTHNGGDGDGHKQGGGL